MKKRLNLTLISTGAIVAVFILVAALGFAGIGSLGQNAGDKSVKSLEDVLKKAAVQCYATEGSYPPDLEYLEEHYGVVLNEQAYFYHYEIVGANIMPNIAVIKK